MNNKKIFNFLKKLPFELNKQYSKLSKLKIKAQNKSSNKKYFNPVTNFDKSFEKYIRKLIEGKFPKDSISGEEFKKKSTSNEYEWVIDPIDGTKRFINKESTWSNLIGLIYRKKPKMGLANFPALKRYYINNEKNSFLIKNNKKKLLKTSQKKDFKKINLILNFYGKKISSKEKKIFKFFCQNLLSQKFDSFNYCLLAEGKIDAVIETNLKSYDIVALVPIIEKAGGCVTNWKNQSPINGGNILASSNKYIHNKILKILK